MDTDTYYEAVPGLVDNVPRWLLFKHHGLAGKRFRDKHGHFATLDDAQSAINHLESAPVRIPAKAEP